MSITKKQRILFIWSFLFGRRSDFNLLEKIVFFPFILAVAIVLAVWGLIFIKDIK